MGCKKVLGLSGCKGQGGQGLGFAYTNSLKGVLQGAIQVFPKIRGTFLGVPIIRTIVFWGLYWGSLILGNYHINPRDSL